MAPRIRSIRQEQQALATRLRAEGRPWGQVADAMRDRYKVNSRVAMRLARGWSQRQVADMWTAAWPADPKSDKAISCWELWPGGGHEPSLTVLGRLADLYECHIIDLLADGADHRSSDAAHRAQATLATIASPDPPDGKLDMIADRLSGMDLEDIAAAAAHWTRRLGDARRPLLVRVSAALSLAAALPDDATTPTPAPTGGPDYSGVWLSRYLYESSSRPGTHECEHYVVLRQDGNRLAVQSLPHTTGSQITMDLSVDGMVVTGTWTERTAPSGHYRGATYHGTLQMLANPSGRGMAGRWVGFGKDFKINSGEWELIWQSNGLSQRDLRDYHMKI